MHEGTRKRQRSGSGSRVQTHKKRRNRHKRKRDRSTRRGHRNRDSRDHNSRREQRRREVERDRTSRDSDSVSRSGSSDSDSDAGHFDGRPGDVIKGRYVILSEMGRGTFGKVYKCEDRKHQDTVAVKIVRAVARYIDSAKIEGSLLDDVFEKQRERPRQLCVKMYSRFHLADHYCMVFEPLGASLYDVIKQNEYKPLPFFVVRSIARQLLEALSFLRSMSLIHTDLKLENVLFVHTRQQVYRVWCDRRQEHVQLPSQHRIKLIDFGGATYDYDDHKASVVNTRQYRGPEVTLRLGWSYPSDLWSAGCILAELFAGDLLFQTHEELEHLALIERLCGGRFPSAMIDACSSSIRHKYFDRHGRVRVDDLSRSARDFVFTTRTLEDVFTLQTPAKDATSDLEREEVMYVAEHLHRLVRDLLCIDPYRRLAADEALQRPILREVAMDDD